MSWLNKKQSSTYKQIITESKVRSALARIRTHVTSYNNDTHNNAPKATWDILYSAALS